MINSEPVANYLHEEINDKDESENDEEGDDIVDEGNLETSGNMAKGYKIGISQKKASELYDMAGVEEPEIKSDVVVLPSPHILTTNDERMVTQAKMELSVHHDLDHFQVQACVALLNGNNVVLMAPCGSGKLLVFYLAVNILREKYNLTNGVGICLQPLKNILSEKK